MADLPVLEAVTLRRDDGIVVMTLNRPDRLNAIDSTMGRDLVTAWRALNDDDEVRVVIVTGAGRGFCTGLDVTSRAGEGVPEQHDYTSSVRLTAIHNGVWKPVITAVNGVCAGGGLHFVADSDITICSETATFLDPHVTVGQVSALEPIGLLRRVPFELVMRMALVGRHERVGAADALRWGLVSEVTEPGELMARARDIATMVARNSPAAVMATKRAIWESLDHGLDAGLRNGWNILQEHYAHPDVEEGPRAFAERREPRWAAPSARRPATADKQR